MGACIENLLALNAKGMVLEKLGMCKSSSMNYKGTSLWSKVLVAQSLRRRRRRERKDQLKVNRRVILLMKRRAVLLEGSRRPINGVEKKVKTLKKLVPNGKSMMGLDGLFRETADYIMTLEMQVKVMQIMVDVLEKE